MEALTAVAVAGPGADRHGEGHRPGRGDHRRPVEWKARREEPGDGTAADERGERASGRSRVTVSNRAAAGVYADRSGPVLVELLRAAGCAVVDGPLVVPDGDPVEAALRDAVAAGYDVVVTTGGTGLTPARPDAGDDRAGAGRGRFRGSPRRCVRPVRRPGCRPRSCPGGWPGWRADADRQPARIHRRRPGRRWPCWRRRSGARGIADPRRRSPPGELPMRNADTGSRSVSSRYRGMMGTWDGCAAGRSRSPSLICSGSR